MSAPADPRAREGEAGFTLVEMLVALMIFALSVALAGSFITRRGPQPPYQTAKAMQSMLLRARSDAGKRLDSLSPRDRVPLELTELDIDEIEEIDAAIVASPHGASAPCG